jgi:hypothetical protein
VCECVCECCVCVCEQECECVTGRLWLGRAGGTHGTVVGTVASRQTEKESTGMDGMAWHAKKDREH